MLKCANPTETVGSSECKSQIEHMLEDLVQSLRDGNHMHINVNNDNNTVDHSELQSNTNYDDISDNLSRCFDLELSNKNVNRQRSYCLNTEV